MVIFVHSSAGKVCFLVAAIMPEVFCVFNSYIWIEAVILY
ncbi:hypothetical protein BROOK1789C_808 [Bathymodiolus brooksi thiotrophic gill symbiont]|nr:hypothetical protein BROOK1789C_808 [Bathymodiolus brooksi thiotrophic gill symbiont]